MKAKIVYVCQECGAQAPKWLGRCADCGAWNSLVEERPVPVGAGAGAAAGAAAERYALAATSGPRLYAEIDTVVAERLSTGIGEFDRVLGGGVVPGSLVLIGGEPGIGKSTLLLQAAAHFAHAIGPVREAATQLLFAAKGQNIPTFLVGHVTKDGSLAGPKVLEHIVDTVLYFEGEKHHSHRVVRAVKNRFGAISELGVFEMTGQGLKPVPNPSKLFLAERPTNAPGSAVLCSVEGSRPILVEVQALVSTSSYGTARRMASGIDQQRLSLLLAVLEKRAGLNLMGDDVFVNIAGGMTVDEPASDLGVLAAIASSVRNRVIPQTTAQLGRAHV